MIITDRFYTRADAVTAARAQSRAEGRTVWVCYYAYTIGGFFFTTPDGQAAKEFEAVTRLERAVDGSSLPFWKIGE